MSSISNVLNNLYSYITLEDLSNVYRALCETVLKEPDTYYEPTLRRLLSEMYTSVGSTRLITSSLVSLRQRLKEIMAKPELFTRSQTAALAGVYWDTLDYLAQELPPQTYKRYRNRNRHLFETL